MNGLDPLTHHHQTISIFFLHLYFFCFEMIYILWNIKIVNKESMYKLKGQSTNKEKAKALKMPRKKKEIPNLKKG